MLALLAGRAGRGASLYTDVRTCVLCAVCATRACTYMSLYLC